MRHSPIGVRSCDLLWDNLGQAHNSDTTYKIYFYIQHISYLSP